MVESLDITLTTTELELAKIDKDLFKEYLEMKKEALNNNMELEQSRINNDLKIATINSLIMRSNELILDIINDKENVNVSINQKP